MHSLHEHIKAAKSPPAVCSKVEVSLSQLEKPHTLQTIQGYTHKINSAGHREEIREVRVVKVLTHPVSPLLLTYAEKACKKAQQEAQTHQHTDRHIDAGAGVVASSAGRTASFRRR